MNRTLRLAHELVRRRQLAALEGFDIHEDPRLSEDDTKIYRKVNKQRKKDYRVVTLSKTKEKLEKWFRERDIPIRIVYGESDQIEAIPKKGVITYQYALILDQEPPTAWMIAHNLGHAIFDADYGTGNPHIYQMQDKDLSYGVKYGKLSDVMNGIIMRMNLEFNKAKQVGSEQGNKIYPTTRSEQIGKIDRRIEAFHEIFTQWIVTGNVKLDCSEPDLCRKWERYLGDLFQETVNEMARLGTVLKNY